MTCDVWFPTEKLSTIFIKNKIATIGILLKYSIPNKVLLKLVFFIFYLTLTDYSTWKVTSVIIQNQLFMSANLGKYLLEIVILDALRYDFERFISISLCIYKTVLTIIYSEIKLIKY